MATFSDKHSSPKGKKVQLRGDDDKKRMKRVTDKGNWTQEREIYENGNYMMTLMKRLIKSKEKKECK